MWNTELNERWEELHFNEVLRGPGNCIMDSGQADAPNTPERVPTHTADMRRKCMRFFSYIHEHVSYVYVACKIGAIQPFLMRA